MTTLTLKQVPPELLEQLRALAERERRSVNQQAIVLLEQALAKPRPTFAEAYAKFRKKVGTIPPGTAEALEGLRQGDLGRKRR